MLPIGTLPQTSHQDLCDNGSSGYAVMPVMYVPCWVPSSALVMMPTSLAPGGRAFPSPMAPMAAAATTSNGADQDFHSLQAPMAAAEAKPADDAEAASDCSTEVPALQEDHADAAEDEVAARLAAPSFAPATIVGDGCRRRQRRARVLRDPAPVVPLRALAAQSGREQLLARQRQQALQRQQRPDRQQRPGAALQASRVLELAFDAEGCRRLQHLLEESPQEQASALAMQLRGHVRAAVESPHANHVIQKIIECLPASSCSFIASELLGAGVAVARHRYGCRVLCRLAEHQAERSSATLALIEEVLVCTHYVCRNEFGKHVINSFLEHGMEEHRKRIACALLPDVLSHAVHRAASYVVQRALEHCAAEEQGALASVMLSGPEAVLALGKTQAGCHVLRALVRHVRCCTPRLLALLRQTAVELAATKYGNVLLQELGVSHF